MRRMNQDGSLSHQPLAIYDTSGRFTREELEVFAWEICEHRGIVKSMQRSRFARTWEWIRTRILRRKPRWLVVHLTDGLDPEDFKGVPVVAAGNRPEDGAGVTGLPKSVTSGLTHDGCLFGPPGIMKSGPNKGKMAPEFGAP